MENGKRKQNQAEVQNGGVTPPDDRTLRKQLMQLSGSYQASDKVITPTSTARIAVTLVKSG